MKVEKKVIWNYVFKRDLGGPERSGITLAEVWSTGGHGTAGRRVVKHGLHIFPNDLGLFFGAIGCGKSYDDKRARKC